MVKIEKVEGGAKPTVIRDEKRCEVFLGQLITPQEYKTLQVTQGKVLVSIYETELVWHEAPVAKAPVSPQITDAVTQAPEAPKPKVVYPAAKTGAKK